MRTIKPKLKGFTLIELLVVIAIIALLIAILMPSLQRVKEQTRGMAYRANLRQYGIAQTIYLDDHDDRYPQAWLSLVKTQSPVSWYQQTCRWHDPRYLTDGPLRPYLPESKVHLCPSFKVLSKSQGQRHPSHDYSIPVVPYYNYSMNVYFDSKSAAGGGGVQRLGSALTKEV